MPLLPPFPERAPANGAERATILLLGGLFAGLLIFELSRDFQPRKLAVPFFLLSWAPLLVIHEGGHALAARLLGWQVGRISLGFGRTRRRFRVAGIPVELRTFPITGFVTPRPLRLRHPRLESCLIYSAGPLAELLIAGGIVLAWEVSASSPFFRVGDHIGLLALQSFCLAAAVGAVLNLMPFPHTGTDGRVSWSDGLGMILSWRLSREDFARRIANEEP